MAKRKEKVKSRTLQAPLISGAIGGPGTGRISYQVDNAIWQGLHTMVEGACLPLDEFYVTVEPRVISHSDVTGWDIGLEPNDENIEAKFNATRKDIEEWLDRIATASSGAPDRQFTLVYNKGGNSLLQAVEHLRRIAIECQGNDTKFRALVEGEEIADAGEVLKRLGSDSCLTLQRVRIEQIPESVLQKNILMITRLLAGVEGGQQLYRLLYDKFSHGISSRARFSIKGLLDDAERSHIDIRVPAAALSSEYDPLISATIFLLQSCVTGLPVDTVAGAVGCERERLEGAMQGLVGSGRILQERDNWFVIGLPKLTHQHGEDIQSRALDELLHYVKAHDMDEDAFSQIHNAVALAKECATSQPRSVFPVFPTLDKLLKRTGDIQLVFDVAQLSIGAAKRIEPRTRAAAEAVAISLVCGVSWAYQRMPGHLDDARSAYVDSRTIAESIEDKVTLAFISKCLGRLCRMEAEQPDLSREAKDSKLRESVQLLQEAVERFDALPDYARKTHEIADSYSLLARTHLAMRESAKVEAAMRNAFSRMENIQSKEYADLLILNGDFEVTRRNFRAAMLSYDKVLELQVDCGPVTSEIRARVLRQRGLCFQASGKTVEAKHDLQAAAEIWNKLGQRESAAAARWEALRSDQNLPDQVMQLLEKESPSVRVEFAELHLKSMTERSSKRAHLSSREQPDKAYFERLIRQARQQNAIRNLNE